MATTRHQAQGLVREVYRRSGARRHHSVSMWDIGTALELTHDQTAAITDYAVDAGWIEHFAMGGDIVITSLGIDLAEEAAAASESSEPNSSSASPAIQISGSITNSTVQIAGAHSSQEAASAEALTVVREAVALLGDAIKGINEQTREVEQLRADVKTVEAQLAAPAPRRTILFETLTSIAENALGSAMGAVIGNLVPNLSALLEKALQLLR